MSDTNTTSEGAPSSARAPGAKVESEGVVLKFTPAASVMSSSDEEEDDEEGAELATRSAEIESEDEDEDDDDEEEAGEEDDDGAGEHDAGSQDASDATKKGGDGSGGSGASSGQSRRPVVLPGAAELLNSVTRKNMSYRKKNAKAAFFVPTIALDQDTRRRKRKVCH